MKHLYTITELAQLALSVGWDDERAVELAGMGEERILNIFAMRPSLPIEISCLIFSNGGANVLKVLARNNSVQLTPELWCSSADFLHESLKNGNHNVPLIVMLWALDSKSIEDTWKFSVSQMKELGDYSLFEYFFNAALKSNGDSRMFSLFVEALKVDPGGFCRGAFEAVSGVSSEGFPDSWVEKMVAEWFRGPLPF